MRRPRRIRGVRRDRGDDPLEPGAQSVKRYCAELGLVGDGVLKLVELDVAGFDDCRERPGRRPATASPRRAAERSASGRLPGAGRNR
jgi:hypothetical protein